MTDRANTPFRKGTGRLAADRFEVEQHFEGTAFQHNADVVTVNPPLTLNSTSVTNVYNALVAVGLELGVLELSGKGFITVGDGYDTYHFSDPTDPGYDANAPYDSTIPAFDTYLDNLLNISDPVDPDYNPLHSRIRDGGVVLIKAGTYKFEGSVNVPPGFILMGEGYGTRIVNQSFSPLAPMFIIIADPIDSRVPDTAVDPNDFMFNRDAVFTNLVISDNFFIPKFLGDTSYLSSINNDSVVPLIQMNAGTSFNCINVKISGRVAFSAGTVVSSATSFAIKLDTAIPTATGTHLKLNNCFIDGFSQPIQFQAVGGVNDYLEIENCKIRSHGYLNADGAGVANNCIINSNDSNIKIVSNSLFGNHDLASTILYIDTALGSITNAQAASKVLIAVNDFVVNRGSATISTPNAIYVNPTTLANFYTSAVVQQFGNNFQNTFGFEIGSSLTVKTISVGADHIVDSAGGDHIIFVDTTSVAITITLPPHYAGRKLIITDSGFNAQNNNITLARNGGTGSIGNYLGNRAIATNGASWTLVSNGTNWYII